jgi:hypothetical protein
MILDMVLLLLAIDVASRQIDSSTPRLMIVLISLTSLFHIVGQVLDAMTTNLSLKISVAIVHLVLQVIQAILFALVQSVIEIEAMSWWIDQSASAATTTIYSTYDEATKVKLGLVILSRVTLSYCIIKVILIRLIFCRHITDLWQQFTAQDELQQQQVV